MFLARERHLRALKTAQAHLAAAAAQDTHWEFFAEELRLAQAALGEISGRVSADDLLGRSFPLLHRQMKTARDTCERVPIIGYSFGI